MPPESAAVPVRPWEVVAVLIWVGLYWAVATAFSFAYSGPIAGEEIAYAVVWTAALGLWMWRVWNGRPMAVRYMRQLLMAFGILAPGGVALIILFTLTGFKLEAVFESWSTPQLVLLTLPMIAVGVVSFMLSRLLRRPVVREWTRAGAAARPTVQRPDGGPQSP
jgi:hypothetical protein